MSAVIATPELMTQAAADLAPIGSTVNAAHLTAAAPTISLPPAAGDEVSAGIAHLFSGYAQDYQALAGKTAAFQDQFVQHLSAGAGAYASAEAVNVASLLKPLTAIGNSVWPVVATAVEFTANAISQLPAPLRDIVLLITALITAPIWVPIAVTWGIFLIVWVLLYLNAASSINPFLR